jgi:hypothetical protein
LRQIQIIGKRVGGDEGREHHRDARLFVGDDITKETAALLVANGLAIEIDGKLQAEIAKERVEAKAKHTTVLQKQNADTNMQRFDRMTAEERERARNEPIIEEGGDIEMFPEDEVKH